MQHVEEILEYQSTPMRYHLIISKDVNEPQAWNVGHSLVDFLVQEKDEGYLAEACYDKCRVLARQYTTQVDGISNVLMLSHFGILFEPSLRFDVNSFIRKMAQSCLVILLTDGLIQGDRLYLSQEPSDYFINLNEINYLVL